MKKGDSGEGGREGKGEGEGEGGRDGGREGERRGLTDHLLKVDKSVDHCFITLMQECHVWNEITTHT